MTIFDTILIVILAGFVFYGLFFGLIKTFGLFFSVVIGVWVASHYYLTIFDWVKNLFLDHSAIGKIIIFFIIFFIVNRLGNFIFALLNSAFNMISVIPFLKSINQIAGVVLGFLMGSLILGLILAIASHYAGDFAWLKNLLAQSKVAPFLLRIVNVTGLLPTANSFAWFENFLAQSKVASFFSQTINTVKLLSSSLKGLSPNAFLNIKF
ncbi:MAG: CvpA family protein [Patescibacteria group bacterium]